MARLGDGKPVPAYCYSPTRFFSRSHYKPIAGAKQRPTGDYDAITNWRWCILRQVAAAASDEE
ncbi:hypothetical protein TGAM01_v202895 [Trichoderma gamsii]|uniref:Uncharacterized protein n=1 Tax=Trichoderma gamsii TaxID=398673 RepID=A0A2P4ZVS9_9HYPO|nr:hypothetical protein TGAM01_v202895 [Trichoderma gamsii]PON28401.1 hypothetical protein TGAM01_v202895 [Trichoderma gamsii]